MGRGGKEVRGGAGEREGGQEKRKGSQEHNNSTKIQPNLSHYSVAGIIRIFQNDSW